MLSVQGPVEMHEGLVLSVQGPVQGGATTSCDQDTNFCSRHATVSSYE